MTLGGILVDTHFAERQREGRLLGFLAHVSQEQLPAIGVGLDERSALVIEAGQATVHAGEGGHVWLYRLDERAELNDGPLNLRRVERLRWSHGHAGAWPPDWDGAEPVVLTVDDGSVRQVE